MIQGRSNFAYRIKGTNRFVSLGLIGGYDTTPIHVDVNLVSHDVLDTEAFRNWNPEYRDAEFILENGKYVCGWAVEKMSKSMYNVVNPDIIIDKYGADTLRLYEMFLGPVEQSKPWDTNGIDGVHKFLRKLWRLFHQDPAGWIVTQDTPSNEEFKVLHRTIKKITDDILRFSFNTSVSSFMICVNELTDLGCHKREILEPLLILISPFAPHLAEELWNQLGNTESISRAQWPVVQLSWLVEDTIEYPVSFNGKMRFKLELSAGLSVPEIEQAVLNHEQSARYLQGSTPKKVVVVPKRIINIVY
jgi:leucyl-tRNA synthetase